MTAALYFDQNYLRGIAKRKRAFAELEPALRAAVANGAITVLESKVTSGSPPPRRRDVMRLRDRAQSLIADHNRT
jgi:hypothetical protein